MSHSPISDYALLSDCRSAALLHRSGSIDWLCFPRFDGPAVFARLLDPDAGHWAISPREDAEVSRRYAPSTMVVETTFRTDTGAAVLVDTLAVGRNERGHDLGAGAPSVVLRRLTGIEGELTCDIEFAPRPEYGLVYPVLEPFDGGVRARGGPDVMVMSSPVALSVEDSTARGQVTVRAGERRCFALHHANTSASAPDAWPASEIDARLDDTLEAWRTWSDLHQSYEGPWRELVHHSGRVLYALTYYPTGAICAAPTTSLPEVEGGARNWDYRYAWVRDASFTLRALWVAACPDEADKFFEFMADAAASQVRRENQLQIVFGVGGEHDLSERELAHLRGWRGSAPVRVGNAAWEQRQLDVYGELLDAASRLPDQVDRLTPSTRTLLGRLADTAATRWHERDHGIWEVRGERRDFVYSKVMCWVALDRAISLADRLDAADRVDEWRRARDEIAEAILAKGWNEQVGAFTQSFGSSVLDASVLMLPITKFLEPTDPRVRSTIDAIAQHLTTPDGLVYRYRGDDGLHGQEGAFLLCTFWLVEALAVTDQTDRATALFEHAISFANDVGLLSEEVDPSTGQLLGNFPQAFSHVGLVNAAWAITEAHDRAT
jgi:alpha,alpha-trehalase